MQAQHGFPHALILTPPPGTAAVRLLVKDVSTGQLVSVNLPYAETAAAAQPAAPAPARAPAVNVPPVNAAPGAAAPN